MKKCFRGGGERFRAASRSQNAGKVVLCSPLPAEIDFFNGLLSSADFFNGLLTTP